MKSCLWSGFRLWSLTDCQNHAEVQSLSYQIPETKSIAQENQSLKKNLHQHILLPLAEKTKPYYSKRKILRFLGHTGGWWLCRIMAKKRSTIVLTAGEYNRTGEELLPIRIKAFFRLSEIIFPKTVLDFAKWLIVLQIHSLLAVAGQSVFGKFFGRAGCWYSRFRKFRGQLPSHHGIAGLVACLDVQLWLGCERVIRRWIVKLGHLIDSLQKKRQELEERIDITYFAKGIGSFYFRNLIRVNAIFAAGDVVNQQWRKECFPYQPEGTLESQWRYYCCRYRWKPFRRESMVYGWKRSGSPIPAF